MAVGDVERPEDDRLTHEELGVRPFPPAPDGFDPVGADDGDLQRYGYPARPTPSVTRKRSHAGTNG